jgi:hypothetical protein
MQRADWEQVVASDYAVPDGANLPGLTRELLDYLASPDPQLRDQFGYEILATWMARDVLSPAAMRAVGEALLPRLQIGLGERDTDSVFTRSFAVLLLAEVVNNHHRHPFLDTRTLDAYLAAGLDYLARERDVRGYVPDHGWAHATAHTADLLLELAAEPYLAAPELARILDAIADTVTAPRLSRTATTSTTAWPAKRFTTCRGQEGNGYANEDPLVPGPRLLGDELCGSSPMSMISEIPVPAAHWPFRLIAQMVGGGHWLCRSPCAASFRSRFPDRVQSQYKMADPTAATAISSIATSMRICPCSLNATPMITEPTRHSPANHIFGDHKPMPIPTTT